MLQRCEGGVDAALQYAKNISKYMKDLIGYLEKRTTLGEARRSGAELLGFVSQKEPNQQGSPGVSCGFSLPTCFFQRWSLPKGFRRWQTAASRPSARRYGRTAGTGGRVSFSLCRGAGAQGAFSCSPDQHAFPVHLPAGAGAGHGARDLGAAGGHHAAAPNLPPGEGTRRGCPQRWAARGLVSETGLRLLLGSASPAPAWGQTEALGETPQLWQTKQRLLIRLLTPDLSAFPPPPSAQAAPHPGEGPAVPSLQAGDMGTLSLALPRLVICVRDTNPPCNQAQMCWGRIRSTTGNSSLQSLLQSEEQRRFRSDIPGGCFSPRCSR